MNANNNPAYVDLLKKLRAQRDHLGWTQVELANKIGRKQAYVAKIETGNQRIDLMEFHKWVKALKLDPLAMAKTLFDALEAFPRGRTSITKSNESTDAPVPRVRLNKAAMPPRSASEARAPRKR